MNAKIKYILFLLIFILFIIVVFFISQHTKKNELFGIFRRGGFSSRIDPIELFFETTRIRLEHKQNKLVVFFISILKLARFLFYYKK